MTYRPEAFLPGPAGTELMPSSEGAFGRGLITSTLTLSNGNFRAVFFTCRRSATITGIRTYVTATAQAGATLARIGLYTVDASDNLTLVASTANDTSLWTSASANVTKSLSSSYAVTRGLRYAVGMIVVGSSTAPVIGGMTANASTELAVVPRINCLLGSQTDLPASVAVGSMTASTAVPYAALAA